MAMRKREERKSECRSAMGRIPGASEFRIITGRESELTSLWSFTRENLEASKPTVDSRRRHSKLLRPNQPQLALGPCSYGPSHSQKMAEIGLHGKTRLSRNDGRDS